jgi:hypothetical protein
VGRLARRARNLGHFFILLDTRVLGSPEWLAQRMTEFARILHDTPAGDPAHPVLRRARSSAATSSAIVARGSRWLRR